MFSCVWLHFKKIFEKYFLMFGKEEWRNKIQKNTDKTQKKNHQIRSNWEKKRERRLGSTRGEIAQRRRRWDWCSASQDCDLAKHRTDRDLAKHRSRSTRSVLSKIVLSLSHSPFARLWALFARPQFRKSFEVKIGTEMNFRGQHCYFTVNWKWFSRKSIFCSCQTRGFYRKSFLEMIFNQFKHSLSEIVSILL